MSKQIKKKYWRYADEINLPSVEKHHKFLWWKWTTTYTPTKYKYDNQASLLEVVNQFIAENKIVDIISFKDNAKTVLYLDYDTEWYERVGGIELVYTVEGPISGNLDDESE
jgi:hypothetical protein